MRTLVAGAAYFAMVFAIAFALGAVRTFWLEPAIGETWAVACETPFLIAAMFFAARTLPRFLKFSRTPASLLGIGLFGLLLQQMAEFGLVMAASESVSEHIAYLGTPAGSIYLSALVAFVLMPLLVLRLKP